MRIKPTLPTSAWRRMPWTLFALFVPGVLFVLGLWLLRNDRRYAWLSDVGRYPWEFWVIAACGVAASCAGVADWRFHRSGQTAIGNPEHHSELLALGAGGVPLFFLMAAASVVAAPHWLLLPILVVVLYTVVMICYDEFVFHRKRCKLYESCLHRVLVIGNGLAWLAWMNWCFVRGATRG